MASSKIVNNMIISTGTTSGWKWTKYSNGEIKAEIDINTSTSWTIVSGSIAHNTHNLTLPSVISTPKSGYATLNSASSYIIGIQVQINSGSAIIESFRLSVSETSFSIHVTIWGTY